MSNYLKPQSPLKNGENYIYPITTADQIVMDDGTRLNAEVSKHLKIDINNAESAEPNGINADSLGGYSADEYMRKDQASVEVNYSVVNNLTKPTDEAKFTQNMIWIDTDAPIGRVFFGDNKPNETFIDGDVWICTGDSSYVQFNALRIGNDYVNMVYPLYAKQYVGGVWVDKEAKSYQNGEWVEWVVYLYKSGGDYAELWNTFDPVYNSKLKLQFDTHMIFTVPSADGGTGLRVILYTDLYDFTGIKGMEVKIKTTKTVTIGISSDGYSTANYLPTFIASQTVNSSTDFTTIPIDFVGISTAYFSLAYHAGAADNGLTVTIDEIKLIK